MRATLHDELMYEAGFETEHHRDLEQRRDRRRARLVNIGIRTFVLVVLLAGAVEFFHPDVPRRVAVAIAALALLLSPIADWLRALLRAKREH